MRLSPYLRIALASLALALLLPQSLMARPLSGDAAYYSSQFTSADDIDAWQELSDTTLLWQENGALNFTANPESTIMDAGVGLPLPDLHIPFILGTQISRTQLVDIDYNTVRLKLRGGNQVLELESRATELTHKLCLYTYNEIDEGSPHYDDSDCLMLDYLELDYEVPDSFLLFLEVVPLQLESGDGQIAQAYIWSRETGLLLIGTVVDSLMMQEHFLEFSSYNASVALDWMFVDDPSALRLEDHLKLWDHLPGILADHLRLEDHLPSILSDHLRGTLADHLRESSRCDPYMVWFNTLGTTFDLDLNGSHDGIAVYPCAGPQNVGELHFLFYNEGGDIEREQVLNGTDAYEMLGAGGVYVLPNDDVPSFPHVWLLPRPAHLFQDGEAREVVYSPHDQLMVPVTED